MRLASLLASATELVCALGAGDRLVARSHECDYPEWVRRLPMLSRPTFEVEGPSDEIDRRVRELVQASRPLYEIDEALLAELAPDVLITQTHCEVCAVTPGDVARGILGSVSRRQVVALRTGTLEGILEGFRDVAEVIGCAEEGAHLVGEIRARLTSVREQVRSLPSPTIACLEWIDPLFPMANWGPELVECAGGTPLLAAAGSHSAAVEWEAVRHADPDVLLVAPCGFGIERTLAEMPRLAARPGWRDLRAVRAGRVFVADGNLYFNRSGPSVFETVDLLAEILHPEAFPPTRRGQWWRPWPD
jgi:iron complex transport system substrate-binding protein